MIKLRHGNCMDILGKMDTGSVDLIVMDPPYKQDGGAGAGSFGGSQRGYTILSYPLCLRVYHKMF